VSVDRCIRLVHLRHGPATRARPCPVVLDGCLQAKGALARVSSGAIGGVGKRRRRGTRIIRVRRRSCAGRRQGWGAPAGAPAQGRERGSKRQRDEWRRCAAYVVCFLEREGKVWMSGTWTAQIVRRRRGIGIIHERLFV
jgi:hypothetical protein